jgi:hypothetical protein
MSRNTKAARCWRTQAAQLDILKLDSNIMIVTIKAIRSYSWEDTATRGVTG